MVREVRSLPIGLWTSILMRLLSLSHFILDSLKHPSLVFSAGGGVRAAVHPGLQQRPQEDVRHTQAPGEDQALLQR